MTDKETILQKLEDIEKSFKSIKQHVNNIEKSFEELKLLCEQVGVTKVYIRLIYTPEDEMSKAKRGVSYGFIKEQESIKKSIIYESINEESIEEKLILINDCFQQILEEVEKPQILIKEEKDYLLIKLCLEGDLSLSLSGRYILQNPNLIQLVQKLRTHENIMVKLAQDNDMKMLKELVY